jgi:hypothetical protein
VLAYAEQTPVGGHEGHAGRHDILIIFPSTRGVWHIEVKTTAAEDADIAKHKGYDQSLRKKFPACDIRHVLLVVSAEKRSYPVSDESNAHVFLAITWQELSGRMRRLVGRPPLGGPIWMLVHDWL